MIVKLFSTDWIRLFDAPIKTFLHVFLFKVHASSLIEFKKPHFVEKQKNITLLRFNEKSPFLHLDDRQIILYRLNKIILMRRLKHFYVFFYSKLMPLH